MAGECMAAERKKRSSSLEREGEKVAGERKKRRSSSLERKGEKEEEEEEEAAPLPTSIPLPGRLLGQSRRFLDFFWDIAKPDQETRLRATQDLLEHLRENHKDEDLLKFTLKRLIDGLASTRETARPGFSLALSQVLQVFEEVPLSTVLEQIKEKHNLVRVKKKLFRNALFGNFFGVLALFQSGRLAKSQEAMVLQECVQLLQGLSEHHAHLKDLPRKTLVDVISEIPEAVFKKVLFNILKDDFTSAFNTPGHLDLLLVGIQKFPSIFHPKKLKVLLGTSTVVTAENIPRLVEVLKMAVKLEKKDRALPTVALDLLKVALKEDAFELFWKEAIENRLLKDMVKDNIGPLSYMCYRLLGSSLPLLSLAQLKMVLQGEVMLRYGTHVLSAQMPDRYKFAPEMETYVGSFLEGCADPEKQLAVMMGFSTLTNRGYPVVPTYWKVVRHLLPEVLQQYTTWLKRMFLSPDLDVCLDFFTKRQQQEMEKKKSDKGECIFRLRKWIIAHLVALVENPQLKKEEAFVMDIARFCFFHAFFETKKPTSKIPETKAALSVPLSEQTRTVTANAFFSLLHHLSSMPALGESAEAEELRQKHLHGLTASGESWIYLLVQYGHSLVSHQDHVKAVEPFTQEVQDAWDRMLQTVEDLRKRERKDESLKTSGFQRLLLLVGIHLFKSPEETVNLLGDLETCIKKACDGKPKKAGKAAAAGGDEELEWVEVIVEALLSLLAQPSGLIRRVCRNVFGLVCRRMTKGALQLILDVLDSGQDQDEDGAIVVTEDPPKKKPLRAKNNKNGDSEESSADDSSEDDEDDTGSSSEEAEDQEMDSNEEDEEVDENFHALMRKALQAGNALGEDDSDDDDDVDDETMMSLDKNLSALFAEQRKRTQARKDEREKLRKEKIMRREFKIKVLDLVEIFLSKQPENPLVFDTIDPLLSVIEHTMCTESNQQEQEYLQKTADIFSNHLCRAKQYCRTVAPLREELHTQLESLVKRACRQSDSSVALFAFSASLYLFRVLKGNQAGEAPLPVVQPKKKQNNSEQSSTTQPGQLPSLGILDLERVTSVYKEALNLFLSKRKSPLTGAMFLDLFERHPFMCRQLINTIVTSITEGARQHQQAQACVLLQKALQTRDFKLLLPAKEWEALIRESTSQVTKTLKMVSKFKVKVDQEKVLKCLELLNYLIKTTTQQKLDVDLEELRGVLQALSHHEGFGKSTRLNDIYWNVMTLLGFTRPAKEKVAPKSEKETEPQKRKKKGFLPDSKKRKLRKKLLEQALENSSKGAVLGEADATPARKKQRRRKKKNRGEGAAQGPALEQAAAIQKQKIPVGGAGEAEQGQLKKKRKRWRKNKGEGAAQGPKSEEGLSAKKQKLSEGGAVEAEQNQQKKKWRKRTGKAQAQSGQSGAD